MPHMPERIVTKCPLCGSDTEVKWTVDCSHNADYNSAFNPKRVWRYCADCHHIHAENYPEDLTAAILSHVDPEYVEPTPMFVPLCADILNEVMEYVDAITPPTILDVGFGAGEMLMTADEMGMYCFGAEIRPEYRRLVKQLLPSTAPYIEDNIGAFVGKDTFDIIILGDVIEHVQDPVGMLKDVVSMLSRNGALWISTPNFDSAMARMAGVLDPMRGVCEHLNWFSKKSLDKMLMMVGLEPQTYRVSRHFNGCQERICVKA